MNPREQIAAIDAQYVAITNNPRLCLEERNELFDAMRTLAEDLAGKVEKARADELAAIKEMAKARGKAMDAQSALDIDRMIGIETAEGRDGLFAKVYAHARKLERELATEREAREQAERLLSNVRAAAVAGAGIPYWTHGQIIGVPWQAALEGIVGMIPANQETTK